MNYYWNRSAKPNSINEVVNYLKTRPFKSENEICINLWDYDRNDSIGSNKKYAELIRRGLKSGKICRVKKVKKYGYGNVKYFYYVPNPNLQIPDWAEPCNTYSPEPAGEEYIGAPGGK